MYTKYLHCTIHCIFLDRYVDLYIAPRFGIPLAYKEFNKMRVSQFVVQLQEICNKDTAQS